MTTDTPENFESPDSMTLRTNPPSTSRINSKLVGVFATLIGSTILISLMWAFQPQQQQENQYEEETIKNVSQPARDLPGYDDLLRKKEPPKLGPALKTEISPTIIAHEKELQEKIKILENQPYLQAPPPPETHIPTPEEEAALEARRLALKDQYESYRGGVFFAKNDDSSTLTNSRSSNNYGLPNNVGFDETEKNIQLLREAGIDTTPFENQLSTLKNSYQNLTTPQGMAQGMPQGMPQTPQSQQTSNLGSLPTPQIPQPPQLNAPSSASSAFGSGSTFTFPPDGVLQQNMQDEKRDFMNVGNEDVYLKDTLQLARSPYEVKAGTVIPVTSITGINSDLPGNVSAQVRENVYDTVTGNYLLIPIGSRLVGKYDSVIAYGQGRVLCLWTRVILPNGSSIQLEGMPGVDLSGFAGLEDEVDHHWLRLISGVVLSSLLAGTAESTSNTGDDEENFQSTFLENLGEHVNDIGQDITEKNLNIQPTITVRPGWNFNIFVHKDMILKPFAL